MFREYAVKLFAVIHTAVAGKSQERERRVRHCPNFSLSSALFSRLCSAASSATTIVNHKIKNSKGVFCCFIIVN